MRYLYRFIILLSLWASPVYGLDFQPVPEDCSNSIDDNGNGVINEGCPQSDVFSTQTGTDIAAKVETGILAGYEVVADALSETGNSVRRIAGTEINKSQIKLSGNATGDYYFWVLSYGDTTESGMWLNTSPLTAYPNSATLGSILTKRATPEWQMVCASGSYLNFRDGTNADCERAITLSGDFDLYIRGRSGVVYICVFASTNHHATPICPTGPLIPPANYVILRTTNTITLDHADLAGANAMTFANPSNTNTATITVKALWKDDTTNRMYIQYETNDADLVTVMTSNDGAFSNEDHFDFRFRNGDENQLTDADLYQVLGNFGPFFLDANFVGGTRTTATSLNTSISISGGKMLLSFDLPAGIAAGDRFLCNANARNRSTAGMTTFSHMHGTTTNAMAVISEYGVCETSNTLVNPGAPDTTAPTVSSCSAISITSNSFIAQCTTNEAGTAWVEYDLDNDAAVAGADKVTLGGSLVGATTFQLAVTGRPASTLHEWNVKVQDAAGNVGTGAIIDTTTASASTANLFASSTGAGTTCSSGSPCKPATLLSQIVAGQIGEFAAGTYQGADEMIAPSSGKSGTAINPITIRCATDGACTIDGQSARIPISLLSNNDWWIVEGFNAHSSGPSGAAVSVVNIGSGSDNNIVRRVCAWNADSAANTSVWGIRGVNNLLEDVCGFGTGRKIFSSAQGGNNTIFRRAWGMFEYSTSTSPKAVFHPGYNATGNILENVIATWKELPGSSGANVYAPFAIGSEGNNEQFLGSIAYFLAGTTVQSSRLAMTDWAAGADIPTHFRDVVLYTALSDRRPFTLASQACSNCTLTNTTEIGGTASSIGSAWVQTNRVDVNTVGEAPNIWNGAGTNGARVCFRYVNGTLTSTKLWPWPMNQRIIDAMTAAGKTPVDVTATMESIFGTIPAACTS